MYTNLNQIVAEQRISERVSEAEASRRNRRGRTQATQPSMTVRSRREPGRIRLFLKDVVTAQL